MLLIKDIFLKGFDFATSLLFAKQLDSCFSSLQKGVCCGEYQPHGASPLQFLPYFLFRKLLLSPKQWKTADIPHAEEVLGWNCNGVKNQVTQKSYSPRGHLEAGKSLWAFGNRDLLLLFEYLTGMEKISSDFLSLHLSLCVPMKQDFYLYWFASEMVT